MSRLYPCMYCTEDGFCKKYSDEEVTSWCVQGPCKDETPSNGDRIRAMTDEELAEYFGDLSCWPNASKDVCKGVANCGECWLDWLKQEAEDENN